MSYYTLYSNTKFQGGFRYSLQRMKEHSTAVCGQFHNAIELIGRRWTGAIIYVLLRSRSRFA